jgi:2-hydroxycyclohexanecarboxyl-CoA dehydrogenase
MGDKQGQGKEEHMDFNLKGKSVIVTGGASNIGRAIVLSFAREGARIAIADRDEPQANKTAADALKLGAESVIAVTCDVTDPASIRAMVQTIKDRFGGIDVLVNNVGWGNDKFFLEKTRADFEREIQLNLWSVIDCIHATLPVMVERGKGSIISIGSDAGRMGEYREAVYAACKGGVIALTKSLAREYGRSQVRFNVVCPGTTMPATEEDAGAGSMWGASGHLYSWNSAEMKARIGKLYPLRRIGEPQDVAGAVVFLASDAASFITGQTLSASGGYTMM